MVSPLTNSQHARVRGSLIESFYVCFCQKLTHTIHLAQAGDFEITLRKELSKNVYERERFGGGGGCMPVARNKSFKTQLCTTR